MRTCLCLNDPIMTAKKQREEIAGKIIDIARECVSHEAALKAEGEIVRLLGELSLNPGTDGYIEEKMRGIRIHLKDLSRPRKFSEAASRISDEAHAIAAWVPNSEIEE